VLVTLFYRDGVAHLLALATLFSVFPGQ